MTMSPHQDACEALQPARVNVAEALQTPEAQAQLEIMRLSAATWNEDPDLITIKVADTRLVRCPTCCVSALARCVHGKTGRPQSASHAARYDALRAALWRARHPNVNFRKIGSIHLVEPGSVCDARPVYDAIVAFLYQYRAMNRESELAFAKMVAQTLLSQHGPVGCELARVLIKYAPNE